MEIINGESVDNGLVFNVENSSAQKLMLWSSDGAPVIEAIVKQ